MTESYDIVIIGAGPAGASAARAAAQKGMKVLMIDRRQRIGVPAQCGEWVAQWVSRCAHFSSKSILQRTETMVTHLPDGTSYEMKGPGYLLDRSLFDKELVASAVLSGAKISIETKAVGLSHKGLVVEQGSKREVIRSKVFIGADGVHSSIGRLVGRPPLKTIVGLQYEVILPEPQSHIDIFFHKDYEGGYAWFFPKGKTANVGVGVIPEKTNLLLGLLDHFLDHLAELRKLSSVDIIAKTGGSIPCGKPQQTVFGNTLLVGDAAGHAHPITGAGILNAAMGGEMAGRIAAEAVAKGDLNHLEQYEMEWREMFGKALSYAAFKREFLEENWNQPGVGFEGLIRKTWVGFKEYYEDRRKIPLNPPFKKGGKNPSLTKRG